MKVTNKRDSFNNLNYIQKNVILDPNFLKQKISSTMNSKNNHKVTEITNTSNNVDFNYYDSEKFRNSKNQISNYNKNSVKQRHADSELIEMKGDQPK